jgi:hypothetical protein
LDKHMRCKQGGPYTERQAMGRVGPSRAQSGPVGSVDSWATACKPHKPPLRSRRPPHGTDLGICHLADRWGGVWGRALGILGCNWFSPVIHSATFSGELLARLQGDLWLGHKPYGAIRSYGAAVAAPCAAGHRDLKPHNFLFLREAWGGVDDSHHAIHD